MSDILSEGTLERQTVEAILHDYCRTEANIDQFRAEVVAKGSGFSSDVLRVHLTWKCNGKSENEGKLPLPSDVIVKVVKVGYLDDMLNTLAGVGENAPPEQKQPQQDNSKAVLSIHKAECNAYKVLTVSKPAPVPIPIIYGYREQNPALIVMEDLGNKAGNVPNLADGLTLGQWRSVVESLADLYAWSLTTDTPWRDVLPGNEKMSAILKPFFDLTDIFLKTTMEKYPEYFGHVDEKLIRKEISIDRFFNTSESYKKLMPELMQMGDTWINNLMFEKNANGSLGDRLVGLIDWQLCFRGAGFHDLAKLAVMSINSDVRKKHGREIFRCFYDRLCKRSAGKFTTPFEVAEKIYNHALALYGLFCVGPIDFLLQHMTKVAEDSTGWRQREMLSRMKAAYDDAVEFYRANPDPFTEV